MALAKRILAGTIAAIVLISISTIMLLRFWFLFPVDLPSEEPLPSYLLVYPKPSQEVSLSNKLEEIVLLDIRGNWYVIPDWSPGKVCVILSPIDILESGDFWNVNSIQQSTSLIVNKELAKSVSIIDEQIFHKNIFRDNVLVAESGGPYRICWESPLQQGYVRVQLKFKDFSYRWWYRNVK